MQSEITERAKRAWNSISDEHNQWDALSIDERETYIALTAALSDKQAGEVKIKPLEDLARKLCDDLISAWLHHHSRDEASSIALAALRDASSRSALVDVPAVEPVNDDLIGYVLRYGGMCRDCADMDGVCQSGQPCDTEQRRAVVKHTISALAYGIKHGFIASPFQSPLREGEDSAEVKRRFHVEWLAGARPPVHPEPMVGRTTVDTFDEAISHMRNQAEDAAFISLEERITTTVDRSADARAALAATRSGSARAAKGCAE